MGIVAGVVVAAAAVALVISGVPAEYLDAILALLLLWSTAATATPAGAMTQRGCCRIASAEVARELTLGVTQAQLHGSLQAGPLYKLRGIYALPGR